MSNPLASAEARQAAERIIKEVFHYTNVSDAALIHDAMAKVLADSYADLVRRLEKAERQAEGQCDGCGAELGDAFCTRCVAQRVEEAKDAQV